MDMPSLAVRQYKTALQRAYERDDAGAIADVDTISPWRRCGRATRPRSPP